MGNTAGGNKLSVVTKDVCYAGTRHILIAMSSHEGYKPVWR